MTQQTDNPWSDIGAEEQRARDAAVAQANVRAAALDTVVDTRARQVRDEPPIIDRQRAQDAARRAETRSAWAEGTASRRAGTGQPWTI